MGSEIIWISNLYARLQVTESGSHVSLQSQQLKWFKEQAVDRNRQGKSHSLPPHMPRNVSSWRIKPPWPEQTAPELEGVFTYAHMYTYMCRETDNRTHHN